MSTVEQLERYRELRRLGVGGMGEVLLAQDTVLGREVALKRLRAGGDRRELGRLRREALVGASLSHPNLVAVYDVLEDDDGDLVIVMEYVEGQTLRDARRDGPLPPERAVSVIESVGRALDHIHARGVVHRDVKPGNVLLGRGGAVKLGDLGIASSADRTRITTAGAVMGTYQYMAPEQLEGSAPTPAVDVYALGALAFETLSGRKARQEDNPLALAHAISTQPPPDLREAWPDATESAAGVLRRAMARDPADRQASAGQLAEQLRAALGSGGQTTPPRRVSERTPPRVARAAPTPVAPGESGGREAGAVASAGPPGVGAGPAAARAPSASAPGRGPVRRPEVPAARPAASGRRRGPIDARHVLPVAAILLVAVAAVAVAASLGGGGSGSRAPRTSAAPASSGSRAARPRRAPGSRAVAPGASSTSGASAPVDPSTPAGATEAFYLRATAHRYDAAWALADPAFRAQLGGLNAFRSQQSAARSLSFQRAAVTSSTGSTATVSIATTSVLANGTHHCTGTVDLVRGAGGWLLHQIHINNC